MTRMLPTLLRAIVVVLSATFVLSTESVGQQSPNRARSQTEAAATAGVEGTYTLSFLPVNQEPLMGRMEIRLEEGREIAIFTSPKLNGPLRADSLSILNGRVFTSILHGGYTFEFQVNGDAIVDAKFSKVVNDKIETGPADIRRVHDTPEV